MSNQTPLNPDGVLAAKEAMRRVLELDSNEARTLAWEAIAPADYPDAVAKPMLSAYLAVAQPEVNSVEELITTRAGLALANAAFNEGLSAGIRACNESLEGEPFVKPVSPYRSEVDE